LELRRRVLVTSVEYAEANIACISILDDRWRLVDHALEAVKRGGLNLEFGVCKGGLLDHIAKRVARRDSGAPS
jgi:hypothetical protein